MPYKTDKIALNDPFLDRRTKLLPCQKEMTVVMFNAGKRITSIAKMFKVNKRLIQFIIYPERKQRNLELRQERGGSSIYYERVAHNAAVKEHRNYKYQTLKNK